MYKKLCAVLVMQRTKPLNQKKTEKKRNTRSLVVTENVLQLNLFVNNFKPKYKYKEIQHEANLYVFLPRKEAYKDV